MKDNIEGPVKLKIKDGPLFIVETMPWLQSASLGFFFPRGSGQEPLKLTGITHFIEHLVFKGTKTKSAKDIVHAFEGVGGVLNGSTSKEMMNVYGRIGSKHLRRGFNIMADMILNSKFLETDINRERSVILEEIRMNKDIPDQYLAEKFSLDVWGKSPLARPIGGSEESIAGITRDDVINWYKTHLNIDKLVITVAGQTDPEEVIGWWQEISGKSAEPLKNHGSLKKHEIKPVKPQWHSGVKVYRRDVEQALIFFGFPAPNVRDDDRYPFQVMESILGGGMGARLFQQIREKAGLAYDIDTGYSAMRGTGVMTIDSQTSPNMLFKLADKTLAELTKLRTKKPGNTEVKRIKDFLEGGMALGMESSSNRMFRNALSQIFLGRVTTTKEVMVQLNDVKADDVLEVAQKYFTAENTACAVLVPNEWDNDDNIITKLKKLIEKHLR